jgi:hypothetical protein
MGPLVFRLLHRSKVTGDDKRDRAGCIVERRRSSL